MYIYVYIYIEREREGEGERESLDGFLSDYYYSSFINHPTLYAI
jgi:hypothetical protein